MPQFCPSPRKKINPKQHYCVTALPYVKFGWDPFFWRLTIRLLFCRLSFYSSIRTHEWRFRLGSLFRSRSGHFCCVLQAIVPWLKSADFITFSSNLLQILRIFQTQNLKSFKESFKLPSKFYFLQISFTSIKRPSIQKGNFLQSESTANSPIQ